MPELPEVEATRRYLLREGIAGHAITGADLAWPGAIRSSNPAHFLRGARGRTIRTVERRAKFLLLRLNDRPGAHPAPLTIVAHLRMTGALLLHPASAPRPRFTTNVLLLDGACELRFLDPRKLGMLWLAADPSSVTGPLGPEPLAPDFTPQALAAVLARRVPPVKALLCEQSLISGLGNIYADESLFAARIHPLTPGAAITSGQASSLHRAIVDVLAAALDKLDAASSSQRPPLETESAIHVFRVPRLPGRPCPACAAPIQRILIRGRGSYCCPTCQPPPAA
ncbi:MAG: formamidopyrimidine-DNA glycosylase [Dehalococcoidia bacterium]|nr:formamidopyrimidine-DNA glycosylase [Dehalococcoidia bacterium]